MKPKSPLTKKLVSNQHKLPDHLKKKILEAPETPMKKSKEERTKEKEMRKAAREKEKRKKMGKNDALSHHLH